MFWARRICAEYSNLMPNITTTMSEPIDLWTRMRRSLGRFSEPGSFVHAPFWANCITNTFVFRFSVHTTITAWPFAGLHGAHPMQTMCTLGLCGVRAHVSAHYVATVLPSRLVPRHAIVRSVYFYATHMR